MKRVETNLIEAARAQTGTSVADMARSGPVLLVFLRHMGCAFCRQSLADLAMHREAIHAVGTRVAFVYPTTEDLAQAIFVRYGVGDLPRVSDPGAVLYRAFGLQRAKPSQYLSWKAFRGFLRALRQGHRIGKPAGDLLLMPGVFLLRGDQIVRSFRHRDVADQPDYLRLATP